MAVAADDKTRFACYCAFQNSIVIRIVCDDCQNKIRLNQMGDSFQPDTNCTSILGVNSKLAAQFFVEFIEKHVGCDQRECLLESKVKKDTRQSAEHQGRNVDVGISYNADHRAIDWCFSCRNSSERRSTSASVEIASAFPVARVRRSKASHSGSAVM